MWSYSDLQWLVAQWSETLCGGRVQGAWLGEGSFHFEIYSRGQLWLLTYSYQIRKSLLFVWPLHRPLRGHGRAHPLVLFSRAHVLGHRVQELCLVIPEERVVQASFFTGTVQWWLVPGVSQCLIQSAGKQVSLFPPRELPKRDPGARVTQHLELSEQGLSEDEWKQHGGLNHDLFPSSFMEFQKKFLIQQLSSFSSKDWANQLYQQLLWLDQHGVMGVEFIKDLPSLLPEEGIASHAQLLHLASTPSRSQLREKLQKEREIKQKEFSSWQRIHELLQQGQQEQAKQEGLGLLGNVAQVMSSSQDWINIFYEKWRQKKEKLQRLEERLAQLETQIACELKNSSQQASSQPSEVAEVASETFKKTNAALSKRKLPKRADLSYRSLNVHGFEIRYARSGPENLKLLRSAQPWDFWIHNRWYPGAFFILLRPHKKHMGPTPAQWFEILTEILRIEKRHESEYLVTEVRYVQPIKGAKPGLVRYRHEKVWHVHL